MIDLNICAVKHALARVHSTNVNNKNYKYVMLVQIN